MNTRVVVTGMGAITPIGNSVEAFWTAVKSNTAEEFIILFFWCCQFSFC